MKQFKLLSFILVALMAISASCHREPIPTPTQTGVDAGSIVSQPIVNSQGVETGYTLSYRSWIVPGEGENGAKAPVMPTENASGAKAAGPFKEDMSGARTAGAFKEDAPYTKAAGTPKAGGASNDTISVTLHDYFYNVDTCAYVTSWDPSKYENYTCNWDRYSVTGQTQNHITMYDSIAVLRVEFEEFSFNYLLDFEVAYYNDGTYSRFMPYYSPIVTDLGLEELETLETIARNDSVFARKVLRHSIKVQVSNEVYILHAVVTLYRYMPDANPSKFVVWSEVLSEVIPTEFQTYENPYANRSYVYYPYKCIFRQHFSDGSTDECEVNFDMNASDMDILYSHALTFRYDYYAVINEDAHCDNVMSLYGVSSIQKQLVETNEEQICEFLKLTTQCSNLTVNFSGVGVSAPYDRLDIYEHSYVYDDGYTFMQKSFDVSCTFSRMEKECDNDAEQIRLKMFFNCAVGNLQTDYNMCDLLFNHL